MAWLARRRPGLVRAARALLGLVLAPLFALLVCASMTPLPPGLGGAHPVRGSVRVLDRGGGLLREVRGDDAMRASPLRLEEAGELPVAALLAAEDRRFYTHPGVDAPSVLRAALQDLRSRRIISGASTLTMQLARLAQPHPRTALGKFREMAMALRIEWSLDKKTILEEYINRAPFGDQVRGLGAASRHYFDKPPSSLSAAEAATLAAIPRGPSLYALTKRPGLVLRRRDRILGRMHDAGVLDDEAHARALREPLTLSIERGAFGAPHLVSAIVSGHLDSTPASGVATLVTTVDRDLQREAESATRAALRPLVGRHVTAASVVVLDNVSGEILAYVGSPNMEDDAHGGKNDGARALRQPGSTLKPFVYGLAMEELGLTGASVLPDIELKIEVAGGVYTPKNYDERYHGPVRLREALADSYNVPAVHVANELGAARLLDRLRALGFTTLDKDADYYGPALALGDGEVRLLDLANAYATLARRGEHRPVRATLRTVQVGGEVKIPEEASPRRVFPAPVAAEITDILRDRSARVASFGERSALDLPFDAAVKTGTSKGFRDNWTVGFTDRVTVAVWVGNFDGSPMHGVSGVTGAAPLFRAVMLAAMRGHEDEPLRAASDPGLTEVAVCALSGGAPGPGCHHVVRERIPSGHPISPCNIHTRVVLDSRNGLLAGPGCVAGYREERPMERFEPRFLPWARAAGRPVVPEASSPLCPESGGGTALARPPHIAFPHDGARYLLDPDRPLSAQTLAVRIEAAGAIRVRLVVDGVPVGSALAGEPIPWPLRAGDHVLLAEIPGGARGEPVRVRVD